MSDDLELEKNVESEDEAPPVFSNSVNVLLV